MSKMVASEKNLRELVLELVGVKERLSMLDSIEHAEQYSAHRAQIDNLIDAIAALVLLGSGGTRG